MEAVKTQWQALPHKKSTIAIAKQIIETKGVYKGFFVGSLPNATRVVLKNIYRYPLMIGMPNLIEQHVAGDPRVAKGLTGLGIALVESLVLCPVERIKVYYMTKADLSERSIGNFVRESKGPLVLEFYRGYWALFTR